MDNLKYLPNVLLVMGVIVIALYLFKSIRKAKKSKRQEEGASISLGFNPAGVRVDTILNVLKDGKVERSASFLESMGRLAQGEMAKSVQELVKTAAAKGWSEDTICKACEAMTGKPLSIHNVQGSYTRKGPFQKGPRRDPNSLLDEDEEG